MSILETILAEKQIEVAARKAACPLEEQKRRAQEVSRRPFGRALKSSAPYPIIAEIKRASPSKGAIRPDLDPIETARAYASAGAACLSVLTDEKFFDGRLEFLAAIRDELPVMPLLRKDFIVNEYQVWESKANGADCILLIAAALSGERLSSLHREAQAADLEVLVEVHSLEEAALALDAVSPSQELLFGINNRDLKTFKVDLAVSEAVMKSLPDLLTCVKRGRESILAVSESGILERADLDRLKRAGVQAFLIGESLVREGNPGENLQRLIA